MNCPMCHCRPCMCWMLQLCAGAAFALACIATLALMIALIGCAQPKLDWSKPAVQPAWTYPEDWELRNHYRLPPLQIADYPDQTIVLPEAKRGEPDVINHYNEGWKRE